MRINKSSENKDRIAIKIKGIDNYDVSFNIGKTTLFKSVLDSYCDLKKLKRDEIELFYDGIKIYEDSRPVDINLNNDSVLNARLSPNALEDIHIGSVSDNDSIYVKILYDLSPNNLILNIKKTLKMGKLLQHACNHFNISPLKHYLHLDGRVPNDATPISLGIEDIEVFTVMAIQSGG